MFSYNAKNCSFVLLFVKFEYLKLRFIVHQTEFRNILCTQGESLSELWSMDHTHFNCQSFLTVNYPSRTDVHLAAGRSSRERKDVQTWIYKKRKFKSSLDKTYKS
jgi:hypothetical protein